MKTQPLFLYLLLLLLPGLTLAQRSVTLINNSDQTIWVGLFGGVINNNVLTPIIPEGGGFRLDAHQQRTISNFPLRWEGRFWARTGCTFNANGIGPCETGDCGNKLACNGATARAVSLAEIRFNGHADLDYYDISLVDGFNVPIEIKPIPGTFTPRPKTDKYVDGIAGCRADLLKGCPVDLQSIKNGKVVACLSACERFGNPEYCCSGAHNTPQTCPPFYYSQVFKNACPDAYSYAYDDQKSTYTCKGAQYQVIFYGSGNPTNPGNNSQLIEAENYTYMSGVVKENSNDGGPAVTVGYIEANDWMAYTGINFPVTGRYRVEYRVASMNGGGRLALETNSGQTVFGYVDINATGGWNNWTTVSHEVNVNAGTYDIGIAARVGGWNINWFRITSLSGNKLTDNTARKISPTVKEETNDLTLYPNPVKDILQLRSKYNLSGQPVQILNSNGSIVLTTTIKNNTVNVANIPPGIYTLIINHTVKKLSGRFIR